MADGEQTLKLTLKLGEPALRHLREGAEKLGLSVEDYASELIEQQLFNYDDYDWGSEDPRGSKADAFDPSEPTYSLEESMATFRAALEQRLTTK